MYVLTLSGSQQTAGDVVQAYILPFGTRHHNLATVGIHHGGTDIPVHIVDTDVALKVGRVGDVAGRRDGTVVTVAY